MLSHAVFNFDDVLFPTSVVSKFYNIEKQAFELPHPMHDQINHLDKLIGNFICKHMVNCKFRVLTHAPIEWINQCLTLTPIIQRLIEWHYVDLVFYEGTTRHTKIHELLSRDRPYGMYVFAGYSLDEDSAIPEQIRKSASVLLRVLLFIRKPSLQSMIFEWERMDVIFNGFMTRKDPVMRNHFVVSDDCQQKYASPGWYASPKVQHQDSGGGGTGHVGGPSSPSSPSGMFTLPQQKPPPDMEKTVKASPNIFSTITSSPSQKSIPMSRATILPPPSPAMTATGSPPTHSKSRPISPLSLGK